MTYDLPRSLEVNGREEPIRWEYTAILDIIAAMNDPDLDDDEKTYVSLFILYENFDVFSYTEYEEAFKKLGWFMNMGNEEDDRKSNVKVVDFEQDYNLLVPAINRVAGCEIRDRDDIHWWSFMSWFMEIGECTYSSVISIRSKIKKGKNLENWEREFYLENKSLVDIRVKLSEEEKKRQEWLSSLLD